MMTPSDFDWTEDEDGSIILRDQPATAVYSNTRGAVVIRQERAWDEDTDTLVILQPQNARAVALAILAIAEDGQNDQPPQHESARSDKTAAERQRRRRSRLKERDADGDVTEEQRDTGRDGDLLRRVA